MKRLRYSKADLLAPDLRRAITAAWAADAGGDAVALGHADDGVVWGRIQGGALSVAADANGSRRVGAKLQRATLLDLRIFNASRELRVWRDADAALRACMVREVPEDDADATAFADHVERDYELIRSPHARPTADGDFVRLEGLAGETHTPPGRPIPRALRVRHYYTADPQTGLLREAEHRYLTLVAWAPEEGTS